MCTLKISLLPDSFKHFNFPRLEVKFPNFSHILKNFFLGDFLTCGNYPSIMLPENELTIFNQLSQD